MGVFENEKRLREGKKFKEEETTGDIFRKKLKEVDKNRDRRKKTDILEIGSSNKPKALEIEKSLENLKEDFRFNKKPERKKRLGPAPKTRRQPIPKRKIGEQKEMIPLAKGGRAGFKRGSKGCKLAMKGKGRAYGKNS